MGQIPLQPVIDFNRYVAERAQYFTGRAWVFEQIDAWLADATGPRFFLLIGEPGSGKTALAARLCQFSQSIADSLYSLPNLVHDFLSAYHFCRARDSDCTDPLTFTRSLALQLARYPEYARALLTIGERDVNIQVEQSIREVHEGGVVQAVVIEHLTISNLNAQECFNRILRDPLRTLYSNGFDVPITILVDGLDEALVHSGQPTIVELLSRLQSLPHQVRFILTSRSDGRIEVAFPEAGGLQLSTSVYDQQNRKDVGDYLRLRLAPGGEFAEKMLHLTAEQVEAKVETLTAKAAGNFQYVTFLLDAIARKLRTFEELDGLPEGLDNLYADSLRDVVKLGKKEWSTTYAPIMGVLSVAQEPLTFEQLQALTEKDDQSIWDGINDLQQFIESLQRASMRGEGDGEVEVFSLYHQSFIDFLRLRQLILPNKKKVRNTFCLPAEVWHKKIADVCEHGGWAAIWQDAKGKPVEQGRREYSRQHYITHLYQAREWERLCAVLDAGDYGHAKIKYSISPLAYTQDLELGRQVATRNELTFAEGLDFLPSLLRYSLLRCTLSSQIDNYPDIAFQVMAGLGQQQKAAELAEMLTEARRKILVCVRIGVQAEKLGNKEGAWQAYFRANNALRKSIQSDSSIIVDILKILAEARPLEQEIPFINELTATALKIRDEGGRMETLVVLAVALAELQEYKGAVAVAHAIPYAGLDEKALCDAVETIVKAKLRDNAATIALSIRDKKLRDEALAALIHSLVEVQAWDKANELAQTYSRGSRFYALATVARARAQAQPELALELLTGMEGLARVQGVDYQENALRVVAVDMARAFLWDKATIVARSIRSQDIRHYTLNTIIEELAKERLWNRALAVAWSMRDKRHNEEEQVKALRSIARALEAAGHHERAAALLAQVVQTICYEGQEDAVLTEVVDALIEAQLWDSAELQIRSIRDPGKKYSSLTALASALFVERPAEAKKLVSEAESIALTLENKRGRDNYGLGAIAMAYAKMGAWDSAIAVAHQIKNSFYQSSALSSVVNGLIAAHDWARAESVAQSMLDAREQNEALAAVVSGLLNAHELDQALALARSMNEGDSYDAAKYKSDALLLILKALIQVQRGELEVDKTAPLHRDTVDGLPTASITSSQTSTQRLNNTMSAFRSLRNQSVKSEALRAGIEAFAEAGLWDQALGAANTLPDEERQSQALLFIISSMIAAGLPDKAAEVARSLRRNDQIAHALAIIAAGFTSGQPTLAAALLSEAISSAQLVHDDDDLKDDALVVFANGLMKVRYRENAAVVAQSISKDAKKARTLSAIVDARDAAGQIERTAALQTEAVNAEHSVSPRKDREKQNKEGDTSKKLEDLLKEQEKAFARVWFIDKPEKKARSLAKIATAMAEAQFLDKARLLLFEAEAAAFSLEDDDDRDFALVDVVEGLVAAQELDDAEVIVATILGSWQKNIAAFMFTLALAKVGQWKRASDMLQHINEAEKRIDALSAMVNARIEQGEQASALQLVQDEWTHASTRNDLLRALRAVEGLLPLQPELGWACYKAFDWVDDFLKG